MSILVKFSSQCGSCHFDNFPCSQRRKICFIPGVPYNYHLLDKHISAFIQQHSHWFSLSLSRSRDWYVITSPGLPWFQRDAPRHGTGEVLQYMGRPHTTGLTCDVTIRVSYYDVSIIASSYCSNHSGEAICVQNAFAYTLKIKSWKFITVTS